MIFWIFFTSCFFSNSKTVFVYLVKVILIQNVTALIFCDHCSSHEKICTIINNHFKCAKCIRRNRFCVFIFLVFNRIQEKLKHQLSQIEIKHEIQLAVLFRLIAKVFRLKKLLQNNKIRIVQKIWCVAFKFDKNNDDVNDEFFIEISLS